MKIALGIVKKFYYELETQHVGEVMTASYVFYLNSK